ncbi:MAG TPA: N-acetylglucosamine-6-phosphate deacetylase, partial [Anaerovibrio sp.]|nr:N-acetylglucosamine-6-phosphate deacetylase [Anaerovibrio sp.]
AIYNYAQNIHIPVWQAVECATRTPARAMGMEKDLGSIEVGKMADITVFDENVHITITFCAGKEIFLE